MCFQRSYLHCFLTVQGSLRVSHLFFQKGTEHAVVTAKIDFLFYIPIVLLTRKRRDLS